MSLFLASDSFQLEKLSINCPGKGTGTKSLTEILPVSSGFHIDKGINFN